MKFQRRFSHRRIVRIGRLGMLVLALVLSACGQAATGGTGTPTGGQTASTATQASLTPILAGSELVVGQNRLPLGVVRSGTPVNDPNLKFHLRFFYLDAPEAEQTKVRGEADAVYRGQGLPFGLYVAYPTFDTAGTWGIEAEMTVAGSAPQTSRFRIDVLDKPITPAVGSQAIPSKNLTSKDVPNLEQLTSDAKPDPDFYQLTIADALATKKPFMVAFSTPGFCQTAVCGPNLEVIKKLKEQYKGKVNFIHVEVYPYPFDRSAQQGKRVPAMDEWNLKSEPWTFLIDGGGTIQAKYEGGLTFAELEPALKQLAAGQPVQPPATAMGRRGVYPS
jgi:hypothetical protein